MRAKFWHGEPVCGDKSAKGCQAICASQPCMKDITYMRATLTDYLLCVQVAAFISAYNGRWPTKRDKTSLVEQQRPGQARRPLVVRSARWRWSRTSKPASFLPAKRLRAREHACTCAPIDVFFWYMTGQ